MIDAKKLLDDLKKLLKKLEQDMRERCKENPSIDAKIRDEYEAAKEKNRTAQAYEIWRDDLITQSAVAWILGCVFVRFLEDNQLIDSPKLSGATKEQLKLASDNHTIYFRQYPKHSDREYLETVFHEMEKLPGISAILDEKHNPLWTLGPSGDGATELLNFWQKIDPTSGNLIHDFIDSEWNTRFLGDLYQDLSESAQKKYALKQTPIFVEEFILDRTLTPAIDEFGYKEVRIIDPTCGSGHFLLGAFDRLFNLYQLNEPGLNARTAAQKVLDSIYGVDINPFATAIAKFRLLLAALKASDIYQLSDAPNFKFNIATGDSLLHSTRPKDTRGIQKNMFDDRLEHYYETEDKEELKRILSQQYHVVVGNPPYITPKDTAANQAYRIKYGSCHMKYSLAVPFMERFFDLALERNNVGYVGMITANSFMKREFGKNLIEKFIPQWDLTHVIDTAGAYIPGHGTPTVIIFARHRQPTTSTIRTVMGINAEPSTPNDAANGLVWKSITSLVNQSSSQNQFISVSDSPRINFHKHPWSIGGGGAADLKEHIEQLQVFSLENIVDSIGFASFTGLDDVFVVDAFSLKRKGIDENLIKRFIFGEAIRDWSCFTVESALVPYDQKYRLLDIDNKSSFGKYVWINRTSLKNVISFAGKTRWELGDPWWGWYRWIVDKYSLNYSIAFAEVASHNHFVFDRGGKVFKQTAPVIKLHNQATEDDHLALLGLLNSSSSCFWMKQVAHQKQMTSGEGVLVQAKSKVPYQFSGTQLGNLPIPAKFLSGKLKDRLLELSTIADATAKTIEQLTATNAIEKFFAEKQNSIKAIWNSYSEERDKKQSKLIFLQEEMDFTVYCMFDLADESLLSNKYFWDEVSLEPGYRPFCILAGKNEEGFEVPSDIPQNWPTDLKELWQKRMNAISASSELRLIEDAHYKRRWIGRQGLFNHARNADEMVEACKEWLLNRLEDPRYWDEVALTSCNKLADKLQQDSEFMQVAEFYRGRPDFDIASLVAELVKAEAVPFLPVLRYKEPGLRNRKLWEETWEKQRSEDEIDARTKLAETDPTYLTEEQAKAVKQQEIGTIAVPPKYKSSDFIDQNFWRLRGKLDVPKERFISYPHCQREADKSLVIAWAGWDHLEQAKAISDYLENVAKQEGWSTERIIPLLAGLLELLPWLKQWHNEIDPVFSERMGDYFQGYVEEEARAIGKTLNEIKDWKPGK